MSRKRWTEDETNNLIEILDTPLNKKLALDIFPHRSWESIRTKRRKLRMELGLWGANHQADKQSHLKECLAKYRPKNIVELYAGDGFLTKNYISVANQVICNERNPILYKKLCDSFKDIQGLTILNERADKLLHRKYVEDDVSDIDWIDLDPFGSALALLPEAFDLIDNGYLYFTLTDLHQLRFGMSSSLFWRTMMLNDTKCPKDIESQLSLIMGWILFDLSRRYYWNGNIYFKKPKLITPVKIKQLGVVQNRIFRILLRIEPARSVAHLKQHLFKSLELFNMNKNYPTYNFKDIHG